MKTVENETKYKIGVIDWIEAFILVIGMLCSRPMIFGNKLSPVGLVILAIIALFECSKKNWSISVNSKWPVLVCSVVFVSYCLTQTILLSSDNMMIGIKTSVYLIGCSATFYVIFDNKKLLTAFVRILYVLLCFFSISFVVTSLLMMVKGWSSIYIMDIDYGYFIDTSVYFPFTTTYGNMPFNGIVFKRLLGFARESGIMQIFYIWGFYMADKFFDKTLPIRILMVIGIGACLSTTGFITFAVSLVFYMDINKLFSGKTLVIIGLIVISLYIILFAQGTSVFTRAAATITDRTEGVSYGLNAFLDNPFLGKGYYDSLGYPNVQTGVNAISSLGQIGIVGFVLWINIYIISFINEKRSKRYIYSNISLLITALCAQPLMSAPIIYFFNYFDYSDRKFLC